jgi:hypothetical protein
MPQAVNQAYRDKALQYWTLSRKWNAQDREPITFGNLIGALNKLGDRCLNHQKLADRVFNLLDRVERNWRNRKRKKTNNVVPLHNTGRFAQYQPELQYLPPPGVTAAFGLSDKITGNRASRIIVDDACNYLLDKDGQLPPGTYDAVILSDLSNVEERVMMHILGQHQSSNKSGK